MQTTRYRSILRGLFAAVMQSRLTPAELVLLSEELKKGNLSDELAYMIDQTVRHFQDSPLDEDINILVDRAEQSVKKKRLSKAALVNIMTSMVSDFRTPPAASVRNVLVQFFSSATNRQKNNFLDVIEVESTQDAYLKGISETRR